MSKRARKRGQKGPEWLSTLPGRWLYSTQTGTLTGSFHVGGTKYPASIRNDGFIRARITSAAKAMLPSEVLSAERLNGFIVLENLLATSIPEVVAEVHELLVRGSTARATSDFAVSGPSPLHQLLPSAGTSNPFGALQPDGEHTIRIGGRSYSVCLELTGDRVRVYLRRPFPPGVSSRHLRHTKNGAELLHLQKTCLLPDALTHARLQLEKLAEAHVEAMSTERAELARLGWAEKAEDVWTGNIRYGRNAVRGELKRKGTVDVYLCDPPAWLFKSDMKACLRHIRGKKYFLHIHSPSNSLTETIARLEVRLCKGAPAA